MNTVANHYQSKIYSYNYFKMKKIILVNLICFLGIFSFAQKQKTMEYAIKRTDFTKGTYKTFTYELKNDSIMVMQYSTNNLLPKLLYSNIINAEQKSKLTKLLKDIDLSKMKSEYINKNVQGENHSVYEIKINQDFKSIYFYFGDEPKLKMIDSFICELLPED